MSKTKIILKNSAVSQKTPLDTDLDYGEIAINYADGQIYYKSVDTTVKPLLVGSDLSSVRTYDFTGDGVTTEYSALGFPNTTFVFFDGILLPREEFTKTATKIQFNTAPDEGVDIHVFSFEKLNFLDFDAAGLGISYDPANHLIILDSTSSSDPDTVVYRDSTGSFAAQNISVENTLFANTINFDGHITDSASLTTNSTAPTVLCSIPANQYRTIKYTVQAVDNTNNNYQAIEILAIHDGVEVIATQYANLVTNQLVANYDTIINNGNVELVVTSEVADPTDYKVTFTATSV